MSVYRTPIEYRKGKLSFFIPRGRSPKTSTVLPVDDIPKNVINPLANDFDFYNKEPIKITFSEVPLKKSKPSTTRKWSDMFKRTRRITPSNYRAGKKNKHTKKHNSRKTRTKR